MCHIRLSMIRSVEISDYPRLMEIGEDSVSDAHLPSCSKKKHKLR